MVVTIPLPGLERLFPTLVPDLDPMDWFLETIPCVPLPLLDMVLPKHVLYLVATLLTDLCLQPQVDLG